MCDISKINKKKPFLRIERLKEMEKSKKKSNKTFSGDKHVRSKFHSILRLYIMLFGSYFYYLLCDLRIIKALHKGNQKLFVKKIKTERR